MPKIAKARSRKRKTESAEKITSTPYKKHLEDKAKTESTKAKKVISITDCKKKLFSKIQIGQQERKKKVLSKEYLQGKKNEKLLNQDKENKNEDPTNFCKQSLAVGKWVLVRYVIISTKFYVGQITKKYDDEQESKDGKKWEVHFLRKTQRSGSNFVDSLSVDQAVDDVDDEDIVTCLPKPTIHRGIHSFNFNFKNFIIE